MILRPIRRPFADSHALIACTVELGTQRSSSAHCIAPLVRIPDGLGAEKHPRPSNADCKSIQPLTSSKKADAVPALRGIEDEFSCDCFQTVEIADRRAA